jgi:uncharacterized protein YndB with AHSA1/START domain
VIGVGRDEDIRMTAEPAARSIRTSGIVKASPEAVWQAFMDPAALVEWLPPAQMTGVIHAFDGRVGGGYEMSLFYPPDEHVFVGKTADKEDRVTVRFAELEPARRIVQTATFATADPSLMGEMRMVITFEPVPGGTLVAMTHTHLPPGLRPEDDEAGSRLSLQQLARRFE